jgi:hypothetical protein
LGQGFDRSFGWSKEKGADHRSGLRLKFVSCLRARTTDLREKAMHRSKSPGGMPFDLHPLPCKARANLFNER